MTQSEKRRLTFLTAVAVLALLASLLFHVAAVVYGDDTWAHFMAAALFIISVCSGAIAIIATAADI